MLSLTIGVTFNITRVNVNINLYNYFTVYKY
jgi:hypothetical protein